MDAVLRFGWVVLSSVIIVSQSASVPVRANRMLSPRAFTSNSGHMKFPRNAISNLAK